MARAAQMLFSPTWMADLKGSRRARYATPSRVSHMAIRRGTRVSQLYQFDVTLAVIDPSYTILEFVICCGAWNFLVREMIVQEKL